MIFFSGSRHPVLRQVPCFLWLLPGSCVRGGPEEGASLDNPFLVGQKKSRRRLAAWWGPWLHWWTCGRPLRMYFLTFQKNFFLEHFFAVFSVLCFIVPLKKFWEHMWIYAFGSILKNWRNKKNFLMSAYHCAHVEKPVIWICKKFCDPLKNKKGQLLF